MEPQEFTALQVIVLVRTHKGGEQEVKKFFNSASFQYHFQDDLAQLVKEQLSEGKVEFNEVIVSFDTVAEKAKKVRKKTSFMGRLLGKE